MNPAIDFLVIGAAKSATTSLFHYLDDHPDTSMPAEKELRFFSDDPRYARGIAWYAAHWPERASDATRRGEASPQYMQVEASAERIASHCPGARLIAVLRDPIERAFAHYRHAKRRHAEQRDFTPLAEAWAAGAPSPGSEDYFEGSCYASALARYERRFDCDQIRIVFTEDLAERPQEIVQSLYAWLGLDASHCPACLNQRYNGGGVGPYEHAYRVASKAYASMRAGLGLRSPIEQLLPGPIGKAYRQMRFRLHTSSRKASEERTPPSAKRVLAEAYAGEVSLLEKAYGVQTPWLGYSVSALQQAG